MYFFREFYILNAMLVGVARKTIIQILSPIEMIPLSCYNIM